ncbi:unnamed protein product [Thelazia callipaeda]|uniref:YqaJ domain-containing protein n=1 Tax=Thelazia callipaeda TaxID=103827 RepID=A0A0N5CR53_THECL|nr:unnamed protein product [Thelazia callipaeda]
MIPQVIEKVFMQAVNGEITDEEAADQIADSFHSDISSNNSTACVTAEQNGVNDSKMYDIITCFQLTKKLYTTTFYENVSSFQQPSQQQPKILGSITLGDLDPAQIAQFQQAFAEASKGLASSVVFNVPMQKINAEEEFTDEDKNRCALLEELITGRRPLVMRPYVFLLNRRFKWTDIAVPVTATDRFRIYRLNQARNSRCYYRCSGCETMAKGSGDPIAQIKLAEGHLAGDVHPVHNSKCEWFTFSTIVNRQFDREARLEVYNGIMTPKQAWNRGRLRALRAVSLAPEGLVNADEYPSWDTMYRIIMKLWRNAKRAHEAGLEVADRVGIRDWWRKIPPPVAKRKIKKLQNYDDIHALYQVDVLEESISMANSDENESVDLLDVVSESEIYSAADQEPSIQRKKFALQSFSRNSAPEPPERISLFSNASDSGKQISQDSHSSVTASNDINNKIIDLFENDSEENGDLQYYVLQEYDDDDYDNEDDENDNDDDEEEEEDDDDNNDDDDDDYDDDDYDDDDENNGSEDREASDESDNDRDINVDSIDQFNVDIDNEVMREYNDILAEVDRLEQKAIAATEGRRKFRRTNGHVITKPQSSQSHGLNPSVENTPLEDHTFNLSEQTGSTFCANRKLFAAIESLTRTLTVDHSRQFHQEMLKTAVELSNHYAILQRRHYTAATASQRTNANPERSSKRIQNLKSHECDVQEKYDDSVIRRRKASVTSPQARSSRKKPKFT